MLSLLDDLTSVSCTSSSFCVALDKEGNAFVYKGSSWASSSIAGSDNLAGIVPSIACTSSSFCLADDEYGETLTYGGSSWTDHGIPITYGSTEVLVLWGLSDVGTVTFKTSGGTQLCSFSSSSTDNCSTATSLAAGAYSDISALNSQMDVISSDTVNLTVDAASLTITASSASFTYGSAPSVTANYSGFVNGDTASSLTTAPTCSTTATASSPVGTYPSSCSGAADANYLISYVAGSVTIEQASLTIAALTGTFTYGTTPTVTANYSGFVNAETASSLATQPTCTTTATDSGPVGAYPSSCSGAVDSNYRISYVSGTVYISLSSLTLTVSASSASFAYGTTPSVTAFYSGFVNGDTPANLTSLPTCSTTATASSPVGSYPSSCSGAVDTGYTIVYAPGTITITSAPLTITASSGSSTYGSTPSVTASYTGFVDGDTPA